MATRAAAAEPKTTMVELATAWPRSRKPVTVTYPAMGRKTLPQHVEVTLLDKLDDEDFCGLCTNKHWFFTPEGQAAWSSDDEDCVERPPPQWMVDELEAVLGAEAFQRVRDASMASWRQHGVQLTVAELKTATGVDLGRMWCDKWPCDINEWDAADTLLSWIAINARFPEVSAACWSSLSVKAKPATDGLQAQVDHILAVAEDWLERLQAAEPTSFGAWPERLRLGTAWLRYHPSLCWPGAAMESECQPPIHPVLQRWLTDGVEPRPVACPGAFVLLA